MKKVKVILFMFAIPSSLTMASPIQDVSSSSSYSKCSQKINQSPLADFYSQIQKIRESDLDENIREIELQELFFGTPYFQPVPNSVKLDLGLDLINPKKATRSVSALVQNRFKKSGIDLTEIEERFDPNRIKTLEIKESHLLEINNVEKTVSFLLGNRWDIVPGRGVLKVRETGKIIPIVIKKVLYRQRLDDLDDEAIVGQGRLLTFIFEQWGRKRVLHEISATLNRNFTQYRPDQDDMTVVYFKLRGN